MPRKLIYSSYSPWGGGFDYWSMWRDGVREVKKQVETQRVVYTPGEYATQSWEGDEERGGDGPIVSTPGGSAHLETVTETQIKKEATGAGIAGAFGAGMDIGKGIGDAVGAYLTAKGKAAQLGAAAGISEDNARVAQFGVDAAFRAGEAQIARIGYEQAEKRGRSLVAFAANGIAGNVGSAAEHMASIDLKASVDKLTAQQNALAQAWGYRRQRMMDFAEADADRIMAKATARAGRVTMYSGLASTAMKAWAGYEGAF